MRNESDAYIRWIPYIGEREREVREEKRREKKRKEKKRKEKKE